MNSQSSFKIVSLKSLLDDPDLKEEAIKNTLSHFSCLDNDVNDFLRNKAILFEKMGMARTYLILDSRNLIAYFSIAIKPLTIDSESWNQMSKNLRHKFSPLGYRDHYNEYNIPAILIGQLGKDQYLGKSIAGKELASIALNQVKAVWELSGGSVVYLEAKDIPFLLKFYTDIGFTRVSLNHNTQIYKSSNGLQLYVMKLDKI
ncbi:hypothetical protein QSJ16_06065 [Limosilactobacillus reuteri]|uniref:N-acetyltransferase n=1 Tax=Limosilactobacillus walteri TaxID=2268022 RepID=A0ABR8PA61_9LACO|nr:MULTISPECIES: N-acetyltransferase [Limosilactobacillus]MBD5807532.1 N-acetyltransferase [Limosilactobacillus walteri]MCC4343147.1 hypothetical protein [Limosilactobacillus reuteri]MCC4355500.1 hypothetical protein [Limosilactobacillus reuteri]WJK29993.1 hypothetical protein QSJ16_06065 [Limosilactobacillus reuteri]